MIVCLSTSFSLLSSLRGRLFKPFLGSHAALPTFSFSFTVFLEVESKIEQIKTQ